MHILLTAATTFEIEPTLQLLEKNDFMLNRRPVKVLITGIGQLNTAFLLSQALLQQPAHLVIQAGIAGAFQLEELGPGQPVLVKYDTPGDLGMEEKGQFTNVFDAGFAGKNQPPFTAGWLVNDHPLLHQTPLPVVRSVTINKVSDDPKQKAQLVSSFDPQTESMEGAALHYVCLQLQQPFLQLRSISNAVGERDKSRWHTAAAVTSLNRELQQLLQQL